MKECQADVLVIGAGPSGAIASALLVRQGWKVAVIERQEFPRFSIGESLLPQCMAFIEQAGMLDAVNAAGFQFKNGAAFEWDGARTAFDFTDKFSPGHGTTFQVQRGNFDKLLADEAARQGAAIYYRHTIVSAEIEPGRARLIAECDGEQVAFTGKFVLDASGFGRVLPRLLDLNQPSDFPVRQSVFTHIQDNIGEAGFDREKILITVHPEQRDIWYWLIPFAGGRASLGVVGKQEQIEALGNTPEEILRAAVDASPNLAKTLAGAQFDTPVQRITGYASDVKSLTGPGFALLGNAGEFLDPVFSSGVTIAMKSAQLASECLHRQLRGETVDWQSEFAAPLKAGVDVFKVYVTAWYEGTFQDVIFHPNPQPEIKRMICSILAGYAWDKDNPYVNAAERRLRTLAEICARD
ncbi:NAD(P)/FAD-dependent oxidoreductase [Microbulbifer bruguierae]|uniref:NAD(P)/FAD-dependent oxidoreductase n=1 Tax=Microbulbifer bruguierae TaxID=3029061 RepID=A0ABY8NCW8_9GAMM|nr:NAD(P)/FAD-dependent oxidoreductase [Microbulbifer bruguierae]WGL15273.1 NAD(P)/FAD-dependent oxidoreductase [Microbulbifer bruguierae]